MEKQLQKLLDEANELRNSQKDGMSYFNDNFSELNNFIIKKLNSSFFKNRNTKIVANHFDEILPFITASNIDILSLNINLLIKQPNFKEKFTEGLKKYPYKEGFDELIHTMRNFISTPGEYHSFFDDDVLKTLASLDISKVVCSEILNEINEEKQKYFLSKLVETGADIPYLQVDFKGNNKQIIYDNLKLFMQNAKNLYALRDFVKDNTNAFTEVKDYIDNNEEQAINSIFYETDKCSKISDPTLKEMIKILVLETVDNEKAKLSDITYNQGGLSRVLLIGDKVIKLGDRVTKNFPNNPYIIAPLLRQELNPGGQSCFAEITERVDTSIEPSKEELYELYKNLRDLGLIWTDIKGINVGRLKKENIIHWDETLDPSDEVLGLTSKRGDKVLKEGDLVILDADFIYDEKDPNINYTNQRNITEEFENRYQSEKRISVNEQHELDISLGVEKVNTEINDSCFHR